MKNRSGQGRKRILSSQEVKKAVKKAKSGETSTEIARDFKKGCPRTIERSLKESGLRWLVVQRREKITPAQQAKRLSFAKKMVTFDWTNVLFVDEKTFQLSGGRQMKWQDPKDRDEISVTRHSPKVHAWGGVGYHWKTDLYLFEQNLNGELYREILSQRIPPNFSLDCPVKKRGNWIFLQDNDPKHTANKNSRIPQRDCS